MARYAITDIHGCYKTFKTLVEDKLKFSKTDCLYLLGDYVNKGPDSKAVLDYIMHLQQEGYQVKCLRGNHDQFLIDASEKGDEAVNLTAEDRQSALQSFNVNSLQEIPPKYISFLKSLPYYLELPDYVLVHAGFDFSNDFRKSSPKVMMNIREVDADSEKLGNRILLHGHTPIPLSQIRENITQKKAAINLDAGCVYYRNKGLGELVALNMDNKRLLVQENLDKNYPIKLKN